MPADALTPYVEKLRECFKNPDRRQAHAESAPVLAQMARDIEVLYAIVRRNLMLPDYLSRTRINPVLAMEIDKQSDFEFILHGWMPRPDRSVEVSHQSIHHHGNLLLTSVSPFGPGYESILFKPTFCIDPDSLVTNLTPERYYHNHLHNLEFIESNTPHVVFYPPEVSVTYALWCSEKKSVSGGLKNFRLVQKYKKQAKKVLQSVGLAKAAGLNVVSLFDFFLEGNRVLAMRERVHYPSGSNENFVQNLFYFLQQIGFSDHSFLRTLALPNSFAGEIRDRFLRGEPIQDSFEPTHLAVPKVNLRKSDLLSHFGLKPLQLAKQA